MGGVQEEARRVGLDAKVKSILFSVMFTANTVVVCNEVANYNLSQTPDVHLKPDPKATCKTRSPFFNGFVFWCSWMYSSSYQIDDELVFP